MAEIVLAGVVGVIVTVLAFLVHHLRETDRQLSALRLKVARNTLAIGVTPPSDAPIEQVVSVVRRKRHLGLIKGGGAAVLVAWLLRRTREQQLAVAATGAAAILAAGAFALLNDGGAQPAQPAHHPVPVARVPRSMPTDGPTDSTAPGVPLRAHGPGASADPANTPTTPTGPLLASESPQVNGAPTTTNPVPTPGPGSSRTTASAPRHSAPPGHRHHPPTTHCATVDSDPVADVNLCLPRGH